MEEEEGEEEEEDPPQSPTGGPPTGEDEDGQHPPAKQPSAGRRPENGGDEEDEEEGEDAEAEAEKEKEKEDEEDEEDDDDDPPQQQQQQQQQPPPPASKGVKGSAKSWLEEDKKGGNMFTNAMVRLSNPGITDQAADTYVDLVSKQGNITLDMGELPMEIWARDTWPGLPTGRKKTILQLWSLVISGLIDESSQGDAERMERSFEHVFEVLDFIHLKLVRAEPRDDAIHDWFEKFALTTKDTVADIQRNPGRYSLGVVWNLLTMQNASCTKDNLPTCRVTHMQILRILRRRVEHALTYDCKTPLHLFHEKMDTHLFNSADYDKMRGAIVAFGALTPEAKIMHACLIQKRFELMALIDMHHRMVDMMTDANAVYSELKHLRTASGSGGSGVQLETRTVERCLNAVDNIEWAAESTWQFSTRYEAQDERARWLDAGLVDGAAAAPGPTNAETKGPKDGAAEEAADAAEETTDPEKLQLGGGDDDVLVTRDVRNASSNIQRAILSARASVRRTYWDMRRSFMNVISFPLTSISKRMMLFLTLSIQPRMQDVLDDLHQRLKRYLSIPYDSDRLVQGAERMQERHLQVLSEATIGETISYRFKDLSAQIMYCLKVLRFAGQLVAMRAASASYMEAFNTAVITRGDPPPPLSQLLYVFLGVDATIQLLVLLAVVLLAYGLPVPSTLTVDREKKTRVDEGKAKSQRAEIDAAFVLDNDFIAAFLADYFMSTAALAAVGLLLGHLFHSKKYFDLAAQGSTTVNAFMVVLTGACATVGAVPFFMMV